MSKKSIDLSELAKNAPLVYLTEGNDVCYVRLDPRPAGGTVGTKPREFYEKELDEGLEPDIAIPGTYSMIVAFPDGHQERADDAHTSFTVDDDERLGIKDIVETQGRANFLTVTELRVIQGALLKSNSKPEDFWVKVHRDYGLPWALVQVPEDVDEVTIFDDVVTEVKAGDYVRFDLGGYYFDQPIAKSYQVIPEDALGMYTGFSLDTVPVKPNKEPDDMEVPKGIQTYAGLITNEMAADIGKSGATIKEQIFDNLWKAHNRFPKETAEALLASAFYTDDVAVTGVKDTSLLRDSYRDYSEALEKIEPPEPMSLLDMFQDDVFWIRNALICSRNFFTLMPPMQAEKSEAAVEDEKRNRAFADIDNAIERIPDDEDDRSKGDRPDYHITP